MKIVYVPRSDAFERDANTIHAAAMASALSGVLANFTYLVPADVKSLITRNKTEFENDFVRYYGLPERVPIHRLLSGLYRKGHASSSSYRRCFYGRAIRWLLKHRVDAVITRSYEIVPMCVKAGINVLFEQHEPADSREFERIEPCVDSAHFLGIVTISEELKRGYVRRLAISEARVFVFPDGVGQERLNRKAFDKKEARKLLGLTGRRHIAVYTGSLFPYKGISNLLQAARLARHVHFVIVGSRPDGSIAQWKKQYPALDNVEFRGHCASGEIPLFLDAADCCVLPNSLEHHSAYYTSPLKLFEYMAARRPIVATDIPALRGVLASGDNAVLVPADDSAALAEAITRLVAEPERADRISRRAFQDVCSLTWNRRAAEILRYFRLTRDAHSA